MSSHHAQPGPSGTLSNERAPQVIVRAGKYFVCSSCGVMVEVPADVVGQMVIVAEHPASEATDDEPAGSKASAQPSSSPQVVVSNKEARLDYPKRSTVADIAFEKIDGLHVPTNGQLDRALAWVAFHLKVLDRQGSERARLKKLLNKHARKATSCSTRRVPGKQHEGQPSHLNKGHHPQSDPPRPATKPNSPVSQNPKERGPP
ncbi:hypothetical protein AB1K70_05225 [Bremerella sp. JC770]|uniref:hypothetical protein n=1 Tax=Bremerella sp. JC770 TaxID=3232137 RepID=UPI00345AA0F0